METLKKVYALYPTRGLTCVGCNLGENYYSDGWRCLRSGLFFHEECTGSSLKIINLYHPQHSLEIKVVADNEDVHGECKVCRGNLPKMYYYCSICDFAIDLICTKKEVVIKIEAPKIHEHQLSLVPEMIRFTCHLCERLDDRFPYVCILCDLSFHKDCGESTPEINYSCHPKHPLKCLTRIPSYTDGKCCLCGNKLHNVFYHCSICNFSVDINCAKSPPPFTLVHPKAHEHPLILMPQRSVVCNVCGMDDDPNPYVCPQCNFMIHRNCTDIPRIIKTNRHVHRISYSHCLDAGDWKCGVCSKEINWTCGAYSCSECPDFAIHLRCATKFGIWDGIELESVSEDTLAVKNSSLPIPIDVIVEIFSRLPLKCIARCRCVSKLWASILRRPDFTELFLTKSYARPQILVAGLIDSELFFFSSPQPQVPVLNSSHVVANPLTRFTFDTHHCIIRGLVNGLVCVEHRILKGSKEMAVVICNPSTGQSLTLPKLKTRIVKVRSLFGYDPIDKQFKVLSMTRPKLGSNLECDEHQVLTLGGTGNLSWRMIECCIPNYYYQNKERCINGVLYYPSVDSSTNAYLIVCFDIRSEKFSFIKVQEPIENALLHGTMIDYNGKLGLIMYKDKEEHVSWAVDRRSRSLLLWVLENPEKQEWSEHIYVLPALWKNIVGEGLLHFAGVTRTNEIVLSSIYQLYLLYVSLERNTVVRVNFQGTDAPNYNTHSTFLDHVEDVKLYARV